MLSAFVSGLRLWSHQCYSCLELLQIRHANLKPASRSFKAQGAVGSHEIAWIFSAVSAASIVCKACLLLACKLGCFMHISGIFLCFRRVFLERHVLELPAASCEDEPGPYATLEVGSEHSERAAVTLCEHAHQSSVGPNQACCSSSVVPLIVHLLKV